ncbi:TPA: XkdX family protein [Listeria innocua]|uniref:XkdX family protein n=1 Tax=Listeria ivanovii subsp. londoniensis TaxID=202752 RepID=A0ABS1G6G2_LISIV|nr:MULTISPECIES: XkdX family protein [Listeria]EAD5841171.1 XkdX family protein [Listeria innocua]EAF5658815.1 XkdX family protein [Listeria innocua]EAH4447208.1 XkdX family protein [Listeria innocua]ECL7896691.1 XkdX family protein [Listeria innocua]ECX4530078.1 XkdX family protein [Listeria innocua]
MINWYEKVKDYFLGGYYTVADVNKFVTLKKITRSQADEILAMKETEAE